METVSTAIIVSQVHQPQHQLMELLEIFVLKEVIAQQVAHLWKSAQLELMDLLMV